MSEHRIIFESIGGLLSPCFPIAPDGSHRVVDGVRYLDTPAVMARQGVPEAAVHETYAAFLMEAGSTARAEKQTANATAMLRKKFSHLSDEHFEEFLEVCRLRNFSPWGTHLWAKTRWSGDKLELQVMLTADGFFAVAMRTREVERIIGPEWCGEDGIWSDVWLGESHPSAARAGVQRRGMTEPEFMVARWCDYVPANPGPDDFWNRMPSFMLGKCASCAAIRRVFAEHLAGIYCPEELVQARTTRKDDADGPKWEPVPVEDLPETSRQFQLRLLDYGLGNASKRELAIAKLRAELPMMYAVNTPEFFRKALARVRANPGAYGAMPPEQVEANFG